MDSLHRLDEELVGRLEAAVASDGWAEDQVPIRAAAAALVDAYRGRSELEPQAAIAHLALVDAWLQDAGAQMSAILEGVDLGFRAVPIPGSDRPS